MTSAEMSQNGSIDHPLLLHIEAATASYIICLQNIAITTINANDILQ